MKLIPFFVLFFVNLNNCRRVYERPSTGIDIIALIDQTTKTTGPAKKIIEEMLSDRSIVFGNEPRDTWITALQCGDKDGKIAALTYPSAKIDIHTFIKFVSGSRMTNGGKRHLRNCLKIALTYGSTKVYPQARSKVHVFFLITDGKFIESEDNLLDKISEARLQKRHVFLILTYHMQEDALSESKFNETFMPIVKGKFGQEDKYIVLFRNWAEINDRILIAGVGTPEDYKDCVMGYTVTNCFDDSQRCIKVNSTFIKEHPDPRGEQCPSIQSQTLSCDPSTCLWKPSIETSIEPTNISPTVTNFESTMYNAKYSKRPHIKTTKVAEETSVFVIVGVAIVAVVVLLMIIVGVIVAKKDQQQKTKRKKTISTKTLVESRSFKNSSSSTDRQETKNRYLLLSMKNTRSSSKTSTKASTNSKSESRKGRGKKKMVIASKKKLSTKSAKAYPIRNAKSSKRKKSKKVVVSSKKKVSGKR